MPQPEEHGEYAVELHSLHGVEVFAAGTHNGDIYTTEDLDSMVEAFGQLDYRPPLKQGHRRDIPGEPALGYIGKLQRAGAKLIADFVDMPRAVLDAIERKSYDGVSAEVYFDLKRGNKMFPKALKAVALLGADIPAVAGLAPLSSLFGEECTFKVYEFTSEVEDMSEDIQALKAKVEQYEAKLTAKTLEQDQELRATKEALATAQATIKLLSAKDREVTLDGKVSAVKIPAIRGLLRDIYSAVLEQREAHYAVGDKKVSAVEVVDALVAKLNDGATAKLFSQVSGVDDIERKDSVEGVVEAGQRIDSEVKKYQTANRGATYAEGLKVVLDSNPDLKAQYLSVN